METKLINQIIVNRNNLINMKKIIQLVTLSIITSFTISCTAQKMVQAPADVIKLKTYSDQFIGKPLKYLFKEIKPPLQLAYGNPEDASKFKLASISFCFIGLANFKQMIETGKEPLTIIVTLERADNKQYPKLVSGPWTDEKTKTYGDMIIRRIGVLGKD